MMSLCDFLRDESQNLANDRRIYTLQLINRTAALLGEIGHPKSNCLDFARGIVEGNMEALSLNASPDQESTYKEICRMFNADKTVESYHFLFIYAPSTGTRVQQTVEDPVTHNRVLEDTYLSLNDDIVKRKQEIQHFISLTFPSQHYDAARCEAIKRECQVLTTDDIVQYISEFFPTKDTNDTNDTDTNGKIRADGALHAVIVFIGHGSPAGFCVHSQIPMKQDDINQLVRDKWNAARRETGSPDLPARVEIIYAQCHGHHYDKAAVQCERFQVFHLTDYVQGTETTSSKKDTNGIWYIVQLDSEANRLNDDIDSCETMRQASVNSVAEPMNVDEKIEQIHGGEMEIAELDPVIVGL